MTDNKTDERRITIKNVRLSYPTLVTPEATIKDGPKKFSANFIIDPATGDGKKNIRLIEKAVEAAEIAEFKTTGKIAKTVRDPKRIAFRDGEDFTNADGDTYAGYEGMKAIAAKANKRPKLWNRRKETVDVEDIEEVFYGGVSCDAVVSFFCVSSQDKGGNGLFCTVEGIRSRQEGESFGGGARASADDFDDLEDDDGMDDDGDLLG